MERNGISFDVYLVDSGWDVAEEVSFRFGDDLDAWELRNRAMEM
jgi:hypothetical protein